MVFEYNVRFLAASESDKVRKYSCVRVRRYSKLQVPHEEINDQLHRSNCKGESDLSLSGRVKFANEASDSLPSPVASKNSGV